jgi:thiamine biosynthesis protein ThiS
MPLSVSVRITPGRAKKVPVPKGATIQDLLDSLSINRETVIVRREGRPVPESDRISSGDKLEIVSIISGG